MNILVLGVTGMLGSAVFRYLCSNTNNNVYGTVRGSTGKKHFPGIHDDRIIDKADVLEEYRLLDIFEKSKPDVVINCIGLIKQFQCASNPLEVLPINSIFPHRLGKVCSLAGARLIHISTDCVFSGIKGAYTESDAPDAQDLYGVSKLIGELHSAPHAITLRTSIIGHELNSNNSLIEWFLSQSESVKGYSRAIFSGLPTVELARVISEYVLIKPEASGLYHVSADPINKYSLLKMVADAYGKKIDIIEDTEVKIDRSLNSSRFRDEFNYSPPDWRELVRRMYEDYTSTL